MTPEQIVRNLAATVLVLDQPPCALCDRLYAVKPEAHAESCPWRQAVEWVAEQAAVSERHLDNAKWIKEQYERTTGRMP